MLIKWWPARVKDLWWRLTTLSFTSHIHSTMVQRQGTTTTYPPTPHYPPQGRTTPPAMEGPPYSFSYHPNEPSMATALMNSVLSPFVQCVAPCGAMDGAVNGYASKTTKTPAIFRTPERYQSSMTVVTPEKHVATHSKVQNTPSTTNKSASFGENDVLCGKGRSSICHPGNQRFRQLIEANAGEYHRATKQQKQRLAQQLVDLITSTGGRFLLKDVETALWYDIGSARSFEKTAQALREKAAQMDHSGNRLHGRPRLVIPPELQHLYGAPHRSASEYRNPPHSSWDRSPPQQQMMYLYPLASASSSFEVASGSSWEVQSPVHSRSPVNVARVPVSPLPPTTALPAHCYAPHLPTANNNSSSSNVWMDSDAPHELIAPSAIRRRSGEDGQAALAAAAFLKLDDFE